MFLLFGLFVHSLHENVSDPIWPQTKKLWKGSLLEVSDTKETKRCTVSLHSCKVGNRWMKAQGLVEISLLKTSGDSVQPSPGDALLFYGKMESLKPIVLPNGFDYATWLKRKGILGRCFAANRWMLLSSERSKQLLDTQPLFMRLRIYGLQARETLLHQYRSLSASDSLQQVLAALTLGSKSGLTPQTRQLYAGTGASHILALSGLHLGILVSCLMMLARPFLPFRKIRITILLSAIVLIWCFAFLTGLSISLLRSAIMYSMWCLFMCRNRAGRSMNSLALAALLLLCVRPNALFDVGFQLSFLSVFAILLGVPIINKLFPVRRWWRFIVDFFFISIIAQMATAPLVAYYFHNFPVYFLFSNCIAIPCTYLLLSFAVLFFLCSGIPVLQHFFGEILSGILEVLHHGLTFISDLPLSSFTIRPSAFVVFLTYIVIAALFLYLRKKVFLRISCSPESLG